MRDDGAVELPRGPVRRVLAAAAWLVAVVLAGTIAWRAVAVLDTDGPRTGVLTSAEVDDALARARASQPVPTAGPSATPAPSPSDEPTVAPGPTGPATTPAVRTWPLPGGEISASCTGEDITLLSATPLEGWTVEIGSTGPERVEVELHSPSGEIEVRAECVDGIPVATERTDDD